MNLIVKLLQKVYRRLAWALASILEPLLLVIWAVISVSIILAWAIVLIWLPGSKVSQSLTELVLYWDRVRLNLYEMSTRWSS